ncbi:flagellar hook-associated protein FlgK [Priestia megaterium]|nr:flagellar hook-associated protein FlgK [Priestia megaterium]
MGSTFHGLQVAKRGMAAQQAALYTIGHNVANANTPGYTRQRVTFEATHPLPAPGMNRPGMTGQLGTGVEAKTIERVRDKFLDSQYRGETVKLGYWDARSIAIEKMEEILNEPSKGGLAKTFDQFFGALQDLAASPSNAGARSVVRERALAVADTFTYLSSSLQTIQSELQNEINVTVTQVNSLMEQLNNVNQQIKDVEPHGYLPNDLYDERDRLLDELSTFVAIDITYTKSGGNDLLMAEGVATVQMQTANGPVTLVDGITNTVNALSVQRNADSFVTGVAVGGQAIGLDNLSQGKLKGLIESAGYINADGEGVGLYPDMIATLDEMAYEFVSWFNMQHQQGVTLDGATGVSFFNPIASKEGAAKMIVLSDAIKESTNNIAAASPSTDNSDRTGDGTNARELSGFRQKVTITSSDGKMTSLEGYYQSAIGQMAVEGEQANRLKENSGILQLAVDQRRQSISAVSLDEEMSNMIQFQHAYNASARMVTMIDEMLEKIVNGLGTGGR